MSVNTLVKHGEIHNIDVPVTILPKYTDKEVEYNPGLARDDKDNLWVSLRACTTDFSKIDGLEHPVNYLNHLYVGKLNEKTLKIDGLKLIKTVKPYPGSSWDIEDVRLFWRKDGLHGIGVILPVENGEYKARQAEILIDYEKGTYQLIKDHGRPKGTIEKNWSPPEHATEAFDFAYSLSEVVKNDEVIGADDHLAVHNGTKLLRYKDGYIQLAHVVCGVGGERTYAHLAVLRDKNGYGTHISQLFHFNVGWREKLQETIEFASDMVWSAGKEGEELLVGLGVKDEATGIARIPVDKFRWDETTDILWYRWHWVTPPNREEIIVPRSIRPDWK
jgi:hypothetical protein